MHSSSPTKHDAVLLLGPTGSGKTPLGELLQSRGLRGRACHHFDFGAQLRQAVQGTPACAMTDEELRFVREVLERGALLEDDRFPLAIRILEGFLKQRRATPADWLVLNGLPRHEGQARGLEPVVQMRAVVELVCDDRTVAARLRNNTGGDRTGRTDDHPDLIARKLRTYHARTRPLIAFYEDKGVPVISLPVDPDTRPEQMADAMERNWPDTVD